MKTEKSTFTADVCVKDKILTTGNVLILDLEKKLNLYSNYENEVSTIDNIEYEESSVNRTLKYRF